MDLGRYAELKAVGKVTMQAVGNTVVVISKVYDVATGVELNDSILPVDGVSLQKQKETLRGQLDAITEFLDDVDKVKVP